MFQEGAVNFRLGFQSLGDYTFGVYTAYRVERASSIYRASLAYRVDRSLGA